MIRFWAICRNTFTQTVRQPIFGVLIAVTFLSLVMTLPLSGFTVAADYELADQLQLQNLGLGTLLIAGMLVAAFSASSVLSREIDDHTALTVISKPVYRSTFVLAKFVGVAAAVALAFYLCSLVFLATVRHHVTPAVRNPTDWPVIVIGISALLTALLAALAGNYFFAWPFVSSAVYAAAILFTAAGGVIGFVGKGWTIIPFGEGIHGQLLVGIYLQYLAVLILVATAVTASTRLGTIGSLLVCCAVLLVGWAHPLLFQPWRPQSGLSSVLSWLVPNLRYLDPRDPLTLQRPFSAGYVGLVSLYAACWTGAILALGAAAFQRRELYGASVGYLPGGVNLLAWAGRIGAAACLIVGAIRFTRSEYHTTGGLVCAGGLMLIGVGGWVLWSSFARGARWSWYVAAGVSGAAAGTGGAALLLPSFAGRLSRYGASRGLVLGVTAVAGLVLLLLLFPKTRHHFRSAA